MTKNLPVIARKFIQSCERIEHGTLRVVAPDGHVFEFGDGAPQAEITINNWNVVAAFASRGEAGVGETYSDGGWDSPDIDALIRVAILNEKGFAGYFDGTWLNRIAMLFVNRFMRRNSKAGSRSNIRAHYDVGNDFYRLWLDDTMTYSSAIFDANNNCLEQAQRKKYDRILAATHAEGDRVLEIGCGWGGFAERAAEQGRNVTGISVSAEQVAFAKDRLRDKARVDFQDYRDVKGTFDSIVSIEMIEAVGERYWPRYFQTLKDRLSTSGTVAIQAITVEDDRFSAYRNRSDYIRHYIFPGGLLLSPGHIADQAARVGLRVDDTYRFGQDYAQTLRAWHQRFADAEVKIRALGHSESFIRTWRFYLQMCAATFATRQTDVMQVKLTHA